ncbi:MAG: phosphonate C-P lyase system protein PhnH [Pseudomonadota bacterium]
MTVAPAFNAPVFDAAYAFRAILAAMSRPGSVHELPVPPDPPAPLSPALAAVLLTLCDFDTPLWLAPSYGEAVTLWCDFHTGAPRAKTPAEASFAFAPLAEAPLLSVFAAVTDERPDRSATLVIGCESLGGEDVMLTGPGIDGQLPFASDALKPQFLDAWRDNGRSYPRGVDVILGAGSAVAALPRTTRIEVR